MKIAYVTMQFPVASETFAAVELRALRRQGADISVHTYRRAPAEAERLLAERGLADLPVHHGGAGAARGSLAALLSHPADAFWLLGRILARCWRHPSHLLRALALLPRSLGLLRELEAERPDVVHLFWGHYPSLTGLLAKRRLPRTAVSLFLGAYDLERRFPLSGDFALQADAVFTHARANLPALAALGLSQDRITVAYRGIDIPPALPETPKIRGLMVIAERLVPQKRTVDALKLFAEVLKSQPDARLTVFGDGPEAANLKSLAAQLGIYGQVTFAGHAPQEDVFRAFDTAEVVLTLSQSPSERLPNALKEAMLRRCLCVSSRSPGIEELITDGETGLLVEAGHPAGAAARLTALLADPEVSARIGRQAQAHVIEDFDVDRLMTERLQRWSALAQRQRQGAAA